jgi:hypothetical protein
MVFKVAKAAVESSRDFLFIQGCEQRFLGHNYTFRRQMGPHGFVIF